MNGEDMTHEQMTLPFPRREIRVGDRVRLTEFGRSETKKYLLDYESYYIQDDELDEIMVVETIWECDDYPYEVTLAGWEIAVNREEIELVG